MPARTSLPRGHPSGQPDRRVAAISEEKNPELLPLIRASNGLAGIVYEVTFAIKPLEIIRFDYEIKKIAGLTQAHVSRVISSNQGTVCWTVDDDVVIQTRNGAKKLRHEWLAESRRFGWSFLGAFSGRVARRLTDGTPSAEGVEETGFGVQIGFYRLISKIGGFTLYDPDKMVDYSKTPTVGRYAFTFWAFPRDEWVANLKEYVTFRDEHFRLHGFRCNMPLGSYFIRKDTSSLLSYSYEGDVISIDPIHAPGEVDREAWDRFLHEFNAWAHARGGVPLLNQSPFITRPHVTSAYGNRWKELCDWIRTVDPDRRMMNEFFEDLVV